MTRTSDSDLIATCNVCGDPEGVPGFERRIGMCVERWCRTCKGTTLQFIGEDWSEQLEVNSRTVRKNFATGR